MQFNVLSLANFPEVVITHFPDTLAGTTQWLEEMEFVFANMHDFVLFYPTYNPHRFQGIDPEERQQSRKNVMLWFKKNRARYQEKCRGIILVTNADGSDQAIIETHRDEVEKVYKVPAKVLYPDSHRAALVQELIASKSLA